MQPDNTAISPRWYAEVLPVLQVRRFVDGWRLLTDPTFDPAGGSYKFGWGTGSKKLTGPAIAAGTVALYWLLQRLT